MYMYFHFHKYYQSNHHQYNIGIVVHVPLLPHYTTKLQPLTVLPLLLLTKTTNIENTSILHVLIQICFLNLLRRKNLFEETFLN